MLNIFLPNEVRTGLVYIQMFNAVALAVFALTFWIAIVFNRDNFADILKNFTFWHFIYIICNIITILCVIYNIFICIISFADVDLFSDIIVWTYFIINTLLSLVVFIVIIFKMYEHRVELHSFESEESQPLLTKNEYMKIKEDEDKADVSEGFSGALYSLVLYLLTFSIFCNIFVAVIYLFGVNRAWWISLICLAPLILSLTFGNFLSSKILFIVFIILLTAGLFILSNSLDLDELVWLFHKHVNLFNT